MLHAAPKIFKETCVINWNQSAKRVYDFVRGLSPYPGTWSELYSENSNSKPIVIKIFKTAKTEQPAVDAVGTLVVRKNHLYVNTADYLLELLELQVSGKKRMDARAFLNGFKDINSYRFKAIDIK